MSSNIGSLPPPFPNAAISLSKVASNAQLRAEIERSSENAPIQTDILSNQVAQPVASTAEANSDGAGDQAPKQDSGPKLDLSI